MKITNKSKTYDFLKRRITCTQKKCYSTHYYYLFIQAYFVITSSLFSFDLSLKHPTKR